MTATTSLPVGNEGTKGMPLTQTAGQYTGMMPAEPVEWVVIEKKNIHT